MKLKIHRIAREELFIKPPKIHTLSRAQIRDIEAFCEKDDYEEG